jgi:hypothetical protein
MKVINHTEIPDATIRLMIKQVAKGMGRKIKGVTFCYTRRHPFLGHAHYDTKMLSVAFAKNSSNYYPVSINQQRHIQFNFPVYDVNNEEENCLAVLAHEAYHFRAHLNGWRNTEKRAETYAFKHLQKWRSSNHKGEDKKQ